MRQLSMLFSIMFILSLSGMAAEKSFHSFKVKDIDGKDKSLADFKGKVVLVLNVASK